MDRYQDKIVTIIPNRLYWLSDKSPPEGIRNAFYFCTDKDLKYYPFFSDFGPLNLAQVIRFSSELEKLLKTESLMEKAIYHYTSEKSTERLNSAFIMGSFMVRLQGPQTEVQRGRSRRHVCQSCSDTHRLSRCFLRRLQLQMHAAQLSSRTRNCPESPTLRSRAFRPEGVRALRKGAKWRHELDHSEQASRILDAKPKQEASRRRKIRSFGLTTYRTTYPSLSTLRSPKLLDLTNRNTRQRCSKMPELS